MPKKDFKNQENNTKEKKSIKEKFADALEISEEIMLNLPKLIFIGNKNLCIENYKGIIEYSNDIIRINTKSSMLKIIGNNLEIKSITDEEIVIFGKIKSLEFIN